jgi:hypothetical protein
MLVLHSGKLGDREWNLQDRRRSHQPERLVYGLG